MGKKADERLTRQLMRGLVDDSASVACIQAREDRRKLNQAKRVIRRIEHGLPIDDNGRRVPPHRSGGGDIPSW